MRARAADEKKREENEESVKREDILLLSKEQLFLPSVDTAIQIVCLIPNDFSMCLWVALISFLT